LPFRRRGRFFPGIPLVSSSVCPAASFGRRHGITVSAGCLQSFRSAGPASRRVLNTGRSGRRFARHNARGALRIARGAFLGESRDAITGPHPARASARTRPRRPFRDVACGGVQKERPLTRSGLEEYSRQGPTLPRSYPRSTIGGRELNFRVRNGNGCDPSPMTTGKRYVGCLGFPPSRPGRSGETGSMLVSTALAERAKSESPQTMSKNLVDGESVDW
jgi:hypothetical protein